MKGGNHMKDKGAKMQLVKKLIKRERKMAL
jgi:hypothetical protein